MMRRAVPFLILAFACAASSAAAQQAKENDVDQTAEQKEKVVCHRERVTGSFMRWRKICVTNSDWKKIEEARGRAADDSFDASRAGWKAGAGGQ